MIYLDYAATTPMSKAAIDAYQQAAQHYFGNPSSLHDPGSEAERILNASREQIGSVLQVPDRRIYFAGSGSEATFLSIVSIAKAYRKQGNHLITTQVEHSSVKNTFSWLESHGYEVTRLPVNRSGLIEMDVLKKSLRKDTILVSVQQVNSETGTIQPLSEIGNLLSRHQAIFHSDMVQGFCKIPVDLNESNIDSITISAHKIHGPKGIGAAYIHPDVLWDPFIPDTTHEKGFRPGTIDVPAAAAFASAVIDANEKKELNLNIVSKLNQQLIEKLKSENGGSIQVEGVPGISSPYIIGLRIEGMEGQYAMLECSQHGLAISTGSACRANEQKPSAALIAMGRSADEAMNFIRLSLDPSTSEQEIDHAVKILSEVIRKHYRSLSTL